MEWLANLDATGGITTVGGITDVAAKAALVLLGALVATRTLRRASASTRHQVWTVALACVLALPILRGVLPAWKVALVPAGVFSATPDAAPVPTADPATEGATTDPMPGAVAGEPVVRAPRTGTGGGSAITPTAADPEAEIRAAADAPAGGDHGGALSAIAALAASSDWSIILLVAWLAGSAILLARIVASSLAAWWLVRRSLPIRDVALRAEALAVRDDLGIRADVKLAQSDKISMPMAWGVLHPTVLLPADSATWRHARRRVVLLHEMAHLKRRDCQTLLLARIVTALHWFNPLAWVATRRLQAERERACDDLVLSMGTRAPDYAQHLLEIARAVRSSASPNWAAVAMARPKELEGRLLAILDPDLNRRRATRIASMAGVLAVGMVVLPLAALQPRAYAQLDPQGAEKSEQQAQTGLETDLPLPVENQLARRLEDRVAQYGETALELDVAAIVESLPLKLGEPQQDEQSVDARVMAVLVTALEDADPDVRAQAASSLGELESPEAVAALAGVLQNDAEARVRSHAAWALGMIEDAGGVPALSGALADADVSVRKQAVWALGMIESPDAVTALAGVASDAEVGVREQVAWALGMIESSAAVDTLSDMLRNDESPKVRGQAAWALGMIEDEAALDALLDAMTDEDVGVRKQVLWAVGQIAG